MKISNNLVDFMNCERLDTDLYRGQSKDLKTGQVYGGQVLGQAIKAAQHSVDEDRHVHSAHAYFLLKGDVNAPIIYEVDRSLDGGSFSSRRVVAKQHGRQILVLSASFQKREDGLDFYTPIKPPVDALENAIKEDRLSVNSYQADYLDIYYLPDEEVSKSESFQFWVKSKTPIPDNTADHNSVLAYISDVGLLHSTLKPHSLHAQVPSEQRKKLIMASIDHAIWFHRPFRADEWFFVDCVAQSTGNGRGFSRGNLYTREGVLFASTSQEGLLRIKRE
ncbi:MAG: acyl-CoA thioesterase II [Arenicella sp.]|jgi:acyl-CoA thioesterase-2|nr:acyl-CoA thioesterase II [Arenicella sp.]HAU68305.1 acyl-CoA thioesterase II [Gammaproteobacteria bacterium]